MHFASGATGLVAAIAVIAGLASAVAFFKASYAKVQITALRDDRDDQAKRIERQDREIEDMKRDLVAERSARQALEKVVTGRDLLEDLKTDLGTHHTVTLTGLSGVHQTMEQVIEVLVEIKAAVAA
jgi:hypothetical protein